MKKLLIASIALNILIVLAFAGKRFYYSKGGAGQTTGNPFYDKWDKMRSSLYDEMRIDSSDIVLLGNSLTEAFPVTEIFGPHVKNRGISGNTTVHVLQRLENIIKGKPRKIFIEIGVNDLYYGFSVDSSFTNYKEIIERIKHQSPATQIFVQSLMPTCMDYVKVLDSAKALNNRLQTYCKEQSLTFIDLYTPMLKDSVLNAAYTADGIHLNNKGYAIWQKAIEKYVK